MRFIVAAVAALVAIAVPVLASDFAPRKDLEIVALDLQTGALKWTHKGTPLGNAHFERYPDLLVAYPHYDTRDKSNPILLNPKTGKVVRDTRDPKKLLQASGGQWAKGPIVLSNGWRLDRFDPGNTKTLSFVHPKTKQVAWTVEPEHYPEYVLAHKDLLLVAYGYLTDEAVIFAHRVGTKQVAWSIDFNQRLNKPAQKKHAQRLGRVAPQILEDVLYVQTGEHVLAIDPQTGNVRWRLDAATKLGIQYEPDLYGGALDVAVFSCDRDMLIVAFEKRILAVRAATGALVWSMVPDTFPHSAFPLAADGTVYLGSGPRRGPAIPAR